MQDQNVWGFFCGGGDLNFVGINIFCCVKFVEGQKFCQVNIFGESKVLKVQFLGDQKVWGQYFYGVNFFGWSTFLVHGGDAVMRVGVKVESGGQEHEVAG